MFNIHGNAYRLIVWIDYGKKLVFIRHILTHAEYDRGSGKMAAKALDVARYGALLKEAHPTAPRNEKENQRLLDLTAGMMNRELSREDHELLEVLLTLIQRFEDAHYALAKASPHETLREMMRARGVTPKELFHVFGSKGTTSEALRGKRSISKNAAKQLAEIFHAGTDRFL